MRIDKTSWLYNIKIAHRGLWGAADLPENSLPAYENAAKHGYAIETDVFKTKDGVLVCFHDDTLKRVTGAEGNIYDYTFSELKKLRLCGSEETIPTFDELLKIAKGRSPLLIEIKNQPDKTVVTDIVKRLKNYDGEFAIQSFNPLYIKKVKKLAPEFIRGILGTATHNKGLTKLQKFITRHMPLNFIVKPDFINYYFGDLDYLKRKRKNKLVLCWTITKQEDFEAIKTKADNIVFEHFIPE